MKKIFWISLITLFTLAAASLLVVQYTQMRRTVEVSDNLFNISVNNAMDDMIEQLNRLKVEDYISQCKSIPSLTVHPNQGSHYEYGQTSAGRRKSGSADPESGQGCN